MQRFGDTGPYEIGNIRKGYPRDNTKTFLKMQAKRASEAAAASLQERIDAMMHEPSAPDPDERIEDEIFRLGMKSSYACRYNQVG